MTGSFDGERKEAAAVVGELERLRYRLLGVQGALKEPGVEKVREMDLEEFDPATELRTVIACVLNDSIEPAIRDLRDVLRETEEPEEPEEDRS